MIYSNLPVSREGPQETGKSVRLSEMSDLSEIQKIMLIRYATRSVSEMVTKMWNYATINNIKCFIQ